MDHGRYAQSYKIKGHEPIEMHPDDAAARDLADSDIVRVYNARGSMLCGVCITDSILKGVVAVSTGAWYDPEGTGPGGRCRHGNPNVLSPDVGTSALSQGPAAHSCLVEVTRLEGEAPDVQAFEPPAFTSRKGDAKKDELQNGDV